VRFQSLRFVVYNKQDKNIKQLKQQKMLIESTLKQFHMLAEPCWPDAPGFWLVPWENARP
jgi:hypothetical protein